LVRRLKKAERAGDVSTTRRLRRRLARGEEDLDEARAALLAHVAGTRNGRRQRARRWSVRHEALRV
jgi:hypothetical protein